MRNAIIGTLFFGFLSVAVAAPFHWKAATTGDWFTAGNWVQEQVPGEGDDVEITNAGSTAILSGSTPLLNSVLIKGFLTFTNWDTTLKAGLVTVDTGGRITHYINTDSNVPWIPNNRIVIECSNLVVEAGGAINADSRGYTQAGIGKKSYGPGGGDGYQAGGGHGGNGGLLDPLYVFSHSRSYGEPFNPTNPGSAGGSHPTIGVGGNGGGAIFITAAEEVRIDGSVSANGGSYVPTYGAGGSGGSILILCGTFSGSGSVKARGGAGVTSGAYGAHGGGGRISIRYSAAQSNLVTQPLVMLDVNIITTANAVAGDRGTIYLPDTLLMRESLTNLNGQVFGFSSWSPDRIACTNNWVRFAEEGFQLRVTNSILVAGSGGGLEVGASRYVAGRLYSVAAETAPVVDVGGDLILTNGGALGLFSTATNGMPDYGASLSVTGQLAVYTNSTVSLYSQISNGGSALIQAGAVAVAVGGRIEADGKGYGNIGTYGVLTYTNMGVGPGFVANNSGGCHGGGGSIAGSVTQNRFPEDLWTATYGSISNPISAGSTGGRHLNTHARIGNDGGGVVRIETTGTVFIAGTLSANGSDAIGDYDGGGAGGSVNIRCLTLDGGGLVRANGGYAKANYGGGGGGGRIAVHYDTTAQAELPVPTLSFSVAAGMHVAGGSQDCVGDVGSLYFPDNRLLVSPLRHTGEWRVEGATNWAVASLLISNQWIRFPEPGFTLVVSNELTVVGSTSLWHRLELSNGWVSCGQMEVRKGRINLMSTEQGGSRLSSASGMVINRGWVGVVSGGTNVVLESGGLNLLNSALLQVEGAATNPAVADHGGWVRVTGQSDIGSGSWMRPLSNGRNGGSVRLNFGTLTVDAGGGFDASAAGFREMGNPNGRGAGPGQGRDYGGAGYGGAGGVPSGTISTANTNGQPYGIANAPIHAGSSGGKHTTFWRPYNWGGGAVRLQADRLTLNGTIKADGGATSGQSYGGGGAGGSILVRSKVFSGLDGTLTARGGNASTDTAGGGGGGGRIALWIGGLSDEDEQTLLAGQDVSRAASSTNWNEWVGSVLLNGGKNTTATPRLGGTGTFVALSKPLYSGAVITIR